MSKSQCLKKDYSFLIWYLISVTAYIVLDVFPDVKKYFIWIKPIPVLLLILQLHALRPTHKTTQFIEYGLFFGMLGDIFLEINGSKYYFEIGVLSFLIGHIFYIIGYFKSLDLVHEKQKTLKLSIVIAFIYLVLVAGGQMTNLHFIFKYLQFEQKIGFGTYAGVLSLMTVSALFLVLISRKQKGIKQSYIFIFVGSLMFFASDNILSEQQKNSNIQRDSKKIMSYFIGITYWLAQLLICEGAIRISQLYKNKNSQKYKGEINRIQNQEDLTLSLVSQT